MILMNTDKMFHVLQDEYGNAAPNGIPSCWEKSAEGLLTLEEYILEQNENLAFPQYL